MKSFSLGAMAQIVLLFCVVYSASGQQTREVDICVYGGTSAGIIAAYTAKKQGKSVLLIEPGKYLGGMTTGGLGATDIGNKYAVTGLSRDFYRRIGGYYNKFEQWTFEPHVADQVFADLIREGNVEVLKKRRLNRVNKKDEWIQEIILEDSEAPSRASDLTVRAKMFIDCTYEGDLMARAGVSYTVGRESNSQYGETFNGVQLLEVHQFSDGVDPYVIPGDPNSGLLWGISPATLGPHGSGDKKVQAYNFRLCLTKDKNNLIPITRPENYNPDQFELLARNIAKEKWETIHSKIERKQLADGKTEVSHTGGFLIKNMPNGKTDFNNFGGFSTDMIGMNHDYPEGDYETRKKIWKAHEDYTKGLLYFMGHDERVPAHLRQEMLSWGYAKDEFKDRGGFPNQLYVREARRMIGETVMTQKHCDGVEVVEDAIGLAAYQMDSHNIQRLVVDGMVKNEGDVQEKVPAPYPISYRAITPNRAECKNLLVPVCLSSSHIAYGSIRMEPVFMVLGQSAATAAVMAIDEKVGVQQVDVKKLQKRLTHDPLVNGRNPEILVDNEDKNHIRVTGAWESKRGGYGPSMLQDESNGSVAKSITFVPAIVKAGKYEAYAYFHKLPNRSAQTHITVFDGKRKEEKVIKTADIVEIGLSSGEWVPLGAFQLPKGKKGFVEISNKGADGVVVADAVLFVPVK